MSQVRTGSESRLSDFRLSDSRIDLLPSSTLLGRPQFTRGISSRSPTPPTLPPQNKFPEIQKIIHLVLERKAVEEGGGSRLVLGGRS